MSMCLSFDCDFSFSNTIGSLTVVETSTTQWRQRYVRILESCRVRWHIVFENIYIYILFLIYFWQEIKKQQFFGFYLALEQAQEWYISSIIYSTPQRAGTRVVKLVFSIAGGRQRCHAWTLFFSVPFYRLNNSSHLFLEQNWINLIYQSFRKKKYKRNL